MTEIIDYLSKAFSGLKPLIGGILSILTYILFPHADFKYALIAVTIAAFLDIFTKAYAIIRKNGGYFKSVRNKKLFSRTMWERTIVKIFSYLIIFALTGLSYRVVFLKEASKIMASFVYSVIFLREFQSNIENLIEAGADLGWLKSFVKKRYDKLMEDREKGEDKR
ncbi:phage holin family protein [Anaerosphaera multitolerans]|uniref:Holin n=1 Tax=Anaerosphaera multitolerans TaxID=2487351 RepID=A0A437S4A3_9FIRM|nr:hypothetical protein [Anaerosphaera multitolerans]RVU53818.1 hypothetical protein EF514_10585 [Anaerosphaera multitolerans]